MKIEKEEGPAVDDPKPQNKPQNTKPENIKPQDPESEGGRTPAMAGLAIAVVLACVLRLLLLRFQFESEIGPVALFYPAVVILLSCSLWLIFFR